MRHIAIIGSGPAGFYTAEACIKLFGSDVLIDLIDRMPVPFGLIRSGVAPDHQSIKAVSKRYEAVALGDHVRFVGNVAIGRDVSIEELRAAYDAVVLATGAPRDRALDIPGADLPGVMGSAAFVGWYNGHPDFAGLDPPLQGPGAAVIGHGNVALDVARILAKTRAEFAGSDITAHALHALESSGISSVTLTGRRGPHQIAMTPKELGELGHLSRAIPQVRAADLPPEETDSELDPGQRKSVALLRQFAAERSELRPPTNAVIVAFDFFAKPVAIEGNGKVERLIVERTWLKADGTSTGTGEHHAIPCSLVISCIGYRTSPLEGVPYDTARGRFANYEGRIAPGLYCVGWARRGPSGTIGTNRPDGYMLADLLAQDIGYGSGKPGGTALDAMLKARSVDVVTYADWQAIEAAEVTRARDGAPREKFTTVSEMLAARAS